MENRYRIKDNNNIVLNKQGIRQMGDSYFIIKDNLGYIEHDIDQQAITIEKCYVKLTDFLNFLKDAQSSIIEHKPLEKYLYDLIKQLNRNRYYIDEDGYYPCTDITYDDYYIDYDGWYSTSDIISLNLIELFHTDRIVYQYKIIYHKGDCI